MSIIEALCLDSVEEKTIFEHVNKLFGYDISDCSIMYVIIYGASQNPKATWEGYRNYLRNGFAGACSEIKYRVYEQYDAEDCSLFQNSHFIGDPKIQWMYCTKHANEVNGTDVLLVHIYVDVLKGQQQDVAKNARKK